MKGESYFYPLFVKIVELTADLQEICDVVMDMDADPRPLTDETLKELGFDNKGKLYVNSAILSVIYDTNNPLYVSMQTQTGYIKYRTVGSVKLLIKALKGEIK